MSLSNFGMINRDKQLPGVWFTGRDAGGVIDGPLGTCPAKSRCI